MRALLPVAGILVAGCGLGGLVQPPGPAHTLRGWNARPLPPDPALAAAAIAPGGACRMHAPGESEPVIPPAILVQDRRTADIATFLVQDAERFGSCTVIRSSGEGGAGWGPRPAPQSEPLTIDDQGGGSLADGTVQELGGRVGLSDVQVVVQVTGGLEVVASVANGYWLAWWPGDSAAARVIARNADGTILASAEPSK